MKKHAQSKSNSERQGTRRRDLSASLQWTINEHCSEEDDHFVVVATLRMGRMELACITASLLAGDYVAYATQGRIGAELKYSGEFNVGDEEAMQAHVTLLIRQIEGDLELSK